VTYCEPQFFCIVKEFNPAFLPAVRQACAPVSDQLFPLTYEIVDPNREYGEKSFKEEIKIFAKIDLQIFTNANLIRLIFKKTTTFLKR